jgi:hypothetical protein
MARFNGHLFCHSERGEESLLMFSFSCVLCVEGHAVTPERPFEFLLARTLG